MRFLNCPSHFGALHSRPHTPLLGQVGGGTRVVTGFASRLGHLGGCGRGSPLGTSSFAGGASISGQHLFCGAVSGPQTPSNAGNFLRFRIRKLPRCSGFCFQLSGGRERKEGSDPKCLPLSPIPHVVVAKDAMMSTSWSKTPLPSGWQ